jgi:hypothetical protein
MQGGVDSPLSVERRRRCKSERGSVRSLGLKPVKLGKKMELQYIAFSELVIPWNVCVESSATPGHNEGVGAAQRGALAYGTMTPDSLKTLKNSKQDNLGALKASVGQFGLLKPFEVAELPEQLGFFFGKGKYVIMDGQRRYFAIRELLRLPTEQDDRRQKENMQTYSGYDYIEKAESQAQEQLAKLTIRDYVLVPCLVYPYTTYLQMVRHSTEGDRVREKPSKIFLEIVENMRRQEIPDLYPDDLNNLWETRNTIMEEQRSIERTLQEIRTRKNASREEVGQPSVGANAVP